MFSSTFGNFSRRVVLVLAVAGFAAAHFTLNMPAPSREKQAYPDTEMYFPIGGSKDLRSKLDCLQLPRGQVASLRAGSTTQFTFEIDETADHPGVCTAQLLDATTGSLVADLGQQNNCVSGPRAMTITLPNKNCASCVVKIKVTATHISTTNPEYYDSCVDVNISGGTGASATITAASNNSSHLVVAAATTSIKTPRTQDVLATKSTGQVDFPVALRISRLVRQMLKYAGRRNKNSSNKKAAMQKKKYENQLVRRSGRERRNRARASANNPSTSDSTETARYFADFTSSAVYNGAADAASDADDSENADTTESGYSTGPVDNSDGDENSTTVTTGSADYTNDADDSETADNTESGYSTGSVDESDAADITSAEDTDAADDSVTADNTESGYSAGSADEAGVADENNDAYDTSSAADATASVDLINNATNTSATDDIFFNDPMLQGV